MVVGVAAVGIGTAIGAGGSAAGLTVGVAVFAGPVVTGAGISAFTAANLILTVASLAYSIGSRPNPKDRSTPGNNALLDRNETDPATRIPKRYGYGVSLPPRLQRYTIPNTLNSLNASTGHKRVTVLHLGWGPYDGGGFRLWRDDTLMFDDVGPDDPDTARTLERITDTIFKFPNPNVQPETVVVYQAGVRFGSGGPADGTISAATETLVSAGADMFTVTHPNTSVLPADVGQYSDENVGGFRVRQGFFFPTDGIISLDSIKLSAWLWPTVSPYIRINFASGFRSTGQEPIPIPYADVGLSYLVGQEKKQYGYLRVHPDWYGGFSKYLTQPLFEDVVLSYQVKPAVNIVVEDSGESFVIFTNPVASGVVVTADFKWTNAPGLVWHLRTGERVQEPTPFPFLANEFLVGSELQQATAVTYTSENEVTDLQVKIVAPNFYRSAVSGRNAGSKWNADRLLRIRIKTSDAPNEAATTLDPKDGWVEVKDNQTGKAPVRIYGNKTNGAEWTFSLADFLNYTQGRVFSQANSAGLGVTGTKLTLDRYMVEVTALDGHGLAENGDGPLDRIQSKVFFGSATEISHYSLTRPYQSTVTIVEDSEDGNLNDGVWAAQLKSAKVWVPAANAVAAGDGTRPEPGTLVFSRNPSWCLADAITNPFWSMGEYFDWDHVPLVEALAYAAFCDEQVDTGDGELETRSQCDGVIRTESAPHDHFAAMLQGQQGYPMQTGGDWKLLKDTERASVMDVTDADLVLNTATQVYPSFEGVPNELDVSFPNVVLDYDLDHEFVRPPGPEPLQKHVERVDYPFCSRLSQVQRVGQQDLAALRHNRRGVPFTALRARILRLEAGDVITWTKSDLYGWTNKKFQVISMGRGSNHLPGINLTEYNPEKVYAASDRIPAPPPVTAPASLQQNRARAVQPDSITTRRLASGKWEVEVSGRFSFRVA